MVFARIDSRESIRRKTSIFTTFERFARIASNLRFAIFSPPPPEARFAKKGVRFGNPETIRENQAIRSNLQIDSRESVHLGYKKHQEWPQQTKPKKGQFMNFSQGHSGTKVQCESCLFSQGKTPEFTKMGEIHELFVLGLFLVWFAGATPEKIQQKIPENNMVKCNPGMLHGNSRDT